MAVKKPEQKKPSIERPQPAKLTAEEVRERMQAFAAGRKGTLTAQVRRYDG